jgi:predicted amidohydrolase YtcJ
MSMDPTLILLNGNIYTMDEENPRANAVAAYGSRIIAVGETDDVQRLVGRSTKVIDLQGKTVIPGLIDCHIHFAAYALRAQEITLDGVASLGEALERIAMRVETTKSEKWIMGGGWDKNLWALGRFPNKEDLDEVSANNPAALESKDCHTLWVNSLALSKASITRETVNPPGGEIERDPETGEATGILKENAIHIVKSVLPESTVEEVTKALKPAIMTAHALGVTSIHVPEGRQSFQAFQRLQSRGELRLRVCMLVPMENLDAVTELGLATGFGNELVRVGMMKMFADGALGSQTAAMLKPYEGDLENRGILIIAVHAIGDRANRMALDVIEDVSEVEAGRSILWRIEHAQHVNPRDLKRYQQLGVIASIQPSHIALDMDIAERHLGRRSREAYPLRSLLDNGVTLAFGSDSPVMPMNPLLGIYTAVTRKKFKGHPSGGWHPEESISIDEAVRAYTLDAAYASGEEGIKGSIEPGKLADLVVLSHNVFEVSEEAIVDVRVEMTVFDGDIVYETQAS